MASTRNEAFKGQTDPFRTWNKIEHAIRRVDQETIGEVAIALMTRLFPICRSITGDGVRETFAILREFADLHIQEVPTGYRAFDWTVPKEWNIRDAYVRPARGASYRLQALQPSRSELQCAYFGHHDSGGTPPSPVHFARATQCHSLPHKLLRGALGVLPSATRPRRFDGGRLRGVYR